MNILGLFHITAGDVVKSSRKAVDEAMTKCDDACYNRRKIDRELQQLKSEYAIINERTQPPTKIEKVHNAGMHVLVEPKHGGLWRMTEAGEWIACSIPDQAKKHRKEFFKEFVQKAWGAGLRETLEAHLKEMYPEYYSAEDGQ